MFFVLSRVGGVLSSGGSDNLNQFNTIYRIGIVTGK